MNNARTQQQQNPQTNPQASTALVHVETQQQAHALVPTSLEGAMQFSQWLAQSSLLPKSVNKEHDIFFVVCAGMELGFPPMAALRSLYAVNGRTALEAKAKAALCLQRGAALYFKKTEDTDKAVTWETHRKGASEPAVSRFTIDDAKHAGLIDKGGPWKQYPRRMMSWKALGFLCDDTYPDVMLGVATKEDFDEEEITFRPIAAVAAGVELGTIPPKPPANTQQQRTDKPAEPPKVEAKALTEDDVADIIEQIGKCGTVAALRELAKQRVAPANMDQATRDKLARVYEEQLEQIKQADAESAQQ